MKKGVAVIVLLFFILVSIAFSGNGNGSNGGNSDKVDKEVEELLKESDEVSVIVVLEDDPNVLTEQYSASQLNKMDNSKKEKMMIAEQQEEVLEKLDLNYDFELKNKFSSVNGFSGEVTEEGLEKLKNDPNVKKIYPNRPVKAFLSDSKNIVNATNAWRLIYNNTNLTGKGETVCVIDTGVDYTHSDLGNCASTININDGSCSKVIGGYNFCANNYCSTENENPMDNHGHGTHVAGIVASTNAIYRGIAHDANIVAVKMLNASGEGSTEDLISSINWCVNNASIFNITVISMSLGSNTLFSSYCDDSDAGTAAAIDAAIAKNISVVSATGNSGSTTGIASPACIKNVTSVGGVNTNDGIAYNRNNITDLLAPGVGITSLANGGGTATASGTSMSTPHAAGAFALIHQYFKLTENKAVMPNETQRYLNDTGKLIVDAGESNLQFSRINIFAAIASLDTLGPNITIINPENNSIKTNLSFIVNITSNEVLANATLEINNTNYTMDGSGIRWSINISSLINGAYTYKIYGNDTFGNRGVSEVFTINIDLIAPYWTNNATNISDINDIKNNGAIQFNITWDDSVGLSGFIFSWNDTGTWNNATNRSLNGKTQIVSVNKTITATRGNVVGYKFYANDSVNNLNETETWTFSIANTIPNTINITINSSDFLNRTNGTLQGFFSFSDVDGDALSGNETKWYNSTEEVAELINYTAITSNYTKKNQNWTFSVRVFDGFNWSEWANSTNLTIKNTKPEINITIDSITINETQKANITTNASDIDNEPLNFTTNDSRFVLDNIYFIWNTNLSDSGMYNINITVNDTEAIDSKIITVIVLDAKDFDNDGNPDFNDTDDDNDGILDGNDFLAGNLSSINTTSAISIAINGTSNLSKLYNGTFFINITNGTYPIIEFNFTFNSSNILYLESITLNRTTNGSSAVSIRGLDLTGINKTKTVFLEKINTTVSAVCIKDIDISFDAISSACSSTNEVLVNCNNQSSNSYTCFDTGTRYKITGLNHSAIKELCVDNDGDGYGTGCALGSDCNDNSFSSINTCSSGDSGNSGGGGSSGGGGGGGGGGAFFTCNMDWKCDEWSDCIKNVQIRDCNFVKVPQHTQSTPCPEQSKAPETSKSCETPKAAAFAAESVNETKTEEKNETEAVKLQEKATTQKKGGALNAITGAVKNVITNLRAAKGLKATAWASIIIFGIVVYQFGYKRGSPGFIAKKFPKMASYKIQYHQNKAERLSKKGLKEKADAHYKKAKEFEEYSKR